MGGNQPLKSLGSRQQGPVLVSGLSGQSGRAQRACPTLHPHCPSILLGRSGHWSWPGPGLSWMSRRGDSGVPMLMNPKVTSSSCDIHTHGANGRAPPHTCHVRSYKTDERLNESHKFHSRR